MPITKVYHGTSIELLEKITKEGLSPTGGELFFSPNEDDITPYSDGLILRFPFPSTFQERVGRGDYYTTTETIPPNKIEYKISTWGDFIPISSFKKAQTDLSGEWWIQDGSAMFADGDIGSYTHEAYVIETVQGEIMEEDPTTMSWEEWKSDKALEIILEQEEILKQQKNMVSDSSRKSKEIDQKIYNIFEKKRDIDYYADEILLENIQNLNFTEDDFNIANGHGDARQYGIQKLNWKRVLGNNIETWTFTTIDLNSIAEGLWEAYQERAKKAKFNIHVWASNTWYYSVPYKIIDQGDPMLLRNYGERLPKKPTGVPNYANNWYHKTLKGEKETYYKESLSHDDTGLSERDILEAIYPFAVEEGEEFAQKLISNLRRNKKTTLEKLTKIKGIVEFLKNHREDPLGPKIKNFIESNTNIVELEYSLEAKFNKANLKDKNIKWKVYLTIINSMIENLNGLYNAISSGLEDFND